MAKEKETKKECNCGCDCQNPTLSGFKYGFGFWIAGLLVFLLIAAVATALFYLI